MLACMCATSERQWNSTGIIVSLWPLQILHIQYTVRYFGSQLQNSLETSIQKPQQVAHMLSLIVDHDAPLRYKTQALLTTYSYC